MKIADVPVRIGLVVVFVLFGLLVLATGSLGIYSLRQSSDLSTQIRTLDDQALDLKDVYINNLKSRSALARAYIALTSHADGKDAAVKAARDYYNAAEKSYAAFAAIPKTSTAQADAARQVEQSFKAHLAALDRLFTALQEGNSDVYVKVNETDMTTTSAAFGTAAAAYFTVRSAASVALEEQQARDASLMDAVVIGVLVLALVLIALVYVALDRAFVRPLNEAVSALGEVSKGNLAVRVRQASANEIGRLFQAIGAMQRNLTDIVGTVRGGTESMVTGVRQLASGNGDLSARTEQQAASLQETAASMEQLTATVRQNTESSRQASALATQASDTAQRGGEAVGQVIDTMERIAQSSDKIVDIISVIEGIAFQTNILALNAAVEAARAGEEGRGFAVVAAEVRSLAQRSASAAKEIKELIEDAVRRIGGGSEQVSRAGATMEEVVRSVKRVTDIMGEIAAASAEQNAGIEQVGTAVTQMDQATQRNAALVEEATAATHSLEEQARQLSQAVSVFRIAA